MDQFPLVDYRHATSKVSTYVDPDESLRRGEQLGVRERQYRTNVMHGGALEADVSIHVTSGEEPK